MKKKVKWSTLILIFIFFVGLCVMLYPSLSSYWNSKTQSQAIVDYEKMLSLMEHADYTEYFEAAEEYNRALAELTVPLMEYGKLEGYRSLDVTGMGVLGYISIDKIAVELPIYHTTSDSVLAFAAGHLEGTSLPIGGESTHSVLSAHRGLPTATLFTHLDRMELGDTFELTILDRTLTYQVDQIKVIDPSNAEDITIVEGEDYCTLLTCTPYGINTHRLLVRGKQVDSATQKNIYITSDAFRIDPLIVTPAVGIPILLILMIIVLATPVKKDDLEV
jgi:sortase A